METRQRPNRPVAGAGRVAPAKPIVDIEGIQQTSSIGLLYGDYGTGKTYLSGTVQEVVNMMAPLEGELPDGWTAMNTTLFVNAEKGELGLPKEHRGSIVVKNVSDWTGICKVYDFIKQHCVLAERKDINKLIQLQQQFLGPKAKDLKVLFIYKAIIFDSLTEIQTLCKNEVRDMDMNTKLSDDLDATRIQDWGTILDKIMMLLRYCRDFVPITKIFIVQTQTDEDDRGKKFCRPMLQGQARDLILGVFDYAGYYTMKAATTGVTRTLYLSPVGPFKAKNRFEDFGDTNIVNPTMKDILKYKLMEEKAMQSEVRFSF